MRLGLALHHYIAFPGDRAILLDTRGDRYHRLGGAASDALRALVAGTVADPAAVAQLTALAVLVPEAEGRVIAVACPSRLSEEVGARANGDLAMQLRASLAVASVRRRLRRRGLDAVLAGARRSVLDRTVDEIETRRLAAAFAAARAWFPGPARCLPDSLALHHLLGSRGIKCEPVIGVRDQPFAAHCWVESGSALLNDALDVVAEFTPILRL